ncbi:signal peptidase I [Enterococcus caccae]|uniref:Signal peptidase I n=1 Tax=Enterococcus caccae ATCC BAA-1240 TaxID=1158612 RepID=R3U956_9ENTE|nr:signal peptidase I [Enterococcus caccae]EOL50474.1 signal peptidase I [Enterococcus caccae ATCC BAA-1240]EOT59089.1 signal peptidase I [Enterococcus caccae ATCC BAA-1240]OJG25621.1 signal peptidase I [Enterococcus caccae]
MSGKQIKKTHSCPEKRPKNKTPKNIHSKKRKTKKHIRYIKQKEAAKKRQATRRQKILFELGASLITLTIVIYILSLFTFSFVKVEGYSMVPTITNGEWVFVNKLAKRRRFKLILYKDPESKETSVRRLIGLPREKIYYKKDKLYVNDHEVYERFIDSEVQRAKQSKSLYTADWTPRQQVIPEGKYLILGDNRPYGIDSRDYDCVDEKNIVGIVEMRVLPIQNLKQF